MKHLLKLQGASTLKTLYVHPDKIVSLDQSMETATSTVQVKLDNGEDSCLYVRGKLEDIKAAWEAALGIEATTEPEESPQDVSKELGSSWFKVGTTDTLRSSYDRAVSVRAGDYVVVEKLNGEPRDHRERYYVREVCNGYALLGNEFTAQGHYVFGVYRMRPRDPMDTF